MSAWNRSSDMHLYNDRIAKVRPGAACSKWLYSNVWAVTVRYSWVAYTCMCFLAVHARPVIGVRWWSSGKTLLNTFVQSPPILSAAYKLHC